MVNKAWFKLMGLADAAFNKNFYVAVVLVLLATNGLAFWFWHESIEKNDLNQKENAQIERVHEREKRQIQNRSDSLRNLDLRYFEHQTDSISRVVYQILREKL